MPQAAIQRYGEIPPEAARKEIDAWSSALQRAFEARSLDGVLISAPIGVLEVSAIDVA